MTASSHTETGPDRHSQPHGFEASTHTKNSLLDKQTPRTKYRGPVIKQYRYGAGLAPSAWAWHAYSDTGERAFPRADGRTWRRLDAFLAATGTTPVVLTEQGVVYRKNDGTITRIGVAANRGNPGPANTAMTALIDEAPARGGSSRISQLFVYHWQGSSTQFDAGLFDPAGNMRSIFTIFCTKVGGTNCGP